MGVRWPRWPLLIVTWIFLSGPLHAAEVVEIEVAPGINATASYHQGDGDKPAILLMHSFLQTRNFSTIARLFDTLSSSGYTLLSPNLSLGINRRKQTLPCESIHTNSIDDDIAEIKQWVEWLAERGQQPITLIGHSKGAMELLAYLHQSREETVKSSILISLSPTGPGWINGRANVEDQKRAEDAVAAGESGLAEYALAYCEKYVTTAANLLSFYRWNFEKIRSAVSATRVPLQIIVGDQDTLIDTDMFRELASTTVGVTIIDGAGHFFDKEFEFELDDAIESYLADQQ